MCGNEDVCMLVELSLKMNPSVWHGHAAIGDVGAECSPKTCRREALCGNEDVCMLVC